ncbi:MAG: adenylate kinase [Actinobacteria bacterium]|nr:adenylate kinase [Actinomycetota bacterium]
MRLILLGAPGVGKGTQAKKIASRYGIAHVSTGDILRTEIGNGSILGKKAEEFVHSGKLVPDALIIDMIREEFKTDKFKTGFLMDGFPRTLEQAQKFGTLLAELEISIDKVVNIIVDENEIINRITSRIVCNDCKKIFKISDFKDKTNLTCDICGSSLNKRKDDSEEIIKNRLEVYKKQTEPLVEFYRELGLLEEVDGLGTENEIFERILARL